MTALVQVDVTEAWARAHHEDRSFTAFVLACVGRAVDAHPEVHAYRDGRGRLVIHPDVDIATMIEIETPEGPFPLAHLVRRADRRSVADLSDELERVASDPAGAGGGRALLRWGSLAGRLPGVTHLLFAAGRRSPRLRRWFGTVAVSAVGMLIGGNGFALGVPTVASTIVVLGGATERPWVVDGEVVVRRILDVSVTIDHRVVDGGPAARFGATLRTLLEHPDVIAW